MIGFYVNNIGRSFQSEAGNEKHLIEALSVDGYTLSRKTLKKFLNDKIFYQDSAITMVLEGVIYNKNVLGRGVWAQDVKNAFTAEKMDFIKQFRGTFAGAFYTANDRTWIIFTNQCGLNTVYYYQKDGVFLAGTDYGELVDGIKAAGHEVNVNENAAYDIMNFGFMTSDDTLIEGVKRLEAGHYLLYDGKTVRVLQYHAFRITDKNHHLTEDEMIDGLDELFRRAVKLEFDKDREYGYRHITSISGGLDSRLTAWVAWDMGYADEMTLMQFGKADYTDEKVAKRVAEKLNTELLIKPLDDARFMTDCDKVIGENNGLSLYPGTAHGSGMYRLMNFDDFGLMHTGDEQLFWTIREDGDYRDTREHRLSIAYSKLHNDKYQIRGRTFAHDWEFSMYTRGFMGNINSTNAKNCFLPHACPFQDVEFSEFVYSLPLDCWKDDSLYRKWYFKKYPDACKIPVERYFGARINHTVPELYLHRALHVGPVEVAKSILRKVFHVKLTDHIRKNHMNPLDYWYAKRPYVRYAMDGSAEKYFRDPRFALKVSDSLAHDLRALYASPTLLDKTIALTILSAYHRYL